MISEVKIGKRSSKRKIKAEAKKENEINHIL